MNIHIKTEPGWSAEHAAIAKQMRADGHSITHIAETLGRKRRAVSQWLARQKVSAGKRPVRKGEWPEANTELMLDMWVKEYSAQQIANVIGYSREAILGKLLRLRKAGEPRAATRSVDVRQRNQAKAERKAPAQRKPATVRNVPTIFPEPFIGREAVVEPLLLNIHELTRSDRCRFICEGFGSEALYCGHATGGGSWCKAHRALVFYPVQKPVKTQKSWWR